MSKDTIDLRPEETLEREIMLRHAWRWVRLAWPLVLAILALSAAFHFLAMRRESGLEGPRQRVATMRNWAGAITPLANRLRLESQRTAVIQALSSEPSWNGILSDIAAAAVGHLQIREIAITRRDPGRQNTGETHAIATITGMAPSNIKVVAFLERLGASRHLRAIELDFSRESRSGQVREGVEFELIAVLQPAGT